MGAEQKKVIVWSWVIAVLVMASLSAWEALVVAWAVYRYPPIHASVLTSAEPGRTEFRRSLQKYFLESGIYIPLEDVMFVDQLGDGGKNYSAALKDNCSGLTGERGLAVWLPLKIRVPLIGERVKEWCWRPSLQS